jgi:hypothetical protein
MRAFVNVFVLQQFGPLSAVAIYRGCFSLLLTEGLTLYFGAKTAVHGTRIQPRGAPGSVSRVRPKKIMLKIALWYTTGLRISDTKLMVMHGSSLAAGTARNSRFVGPPWYASCVSKKTWL